jgi:hypothetical protein
MPFIHSDPIKVRDVASASPESGKPADYIACPSGATECFWLIKFTDEAHTCTVVPWLYAGKDTDDYFKSGDPVDITGNTAFRMYTNGADGGVFLQVTALSNDLELHIQWIEKDV